MCVGPTSVAPLLYGNKVTISITRWVGFDFSNKKRGTNAPARPHQRNCQKQVSHSILRKSFNNLATVTSSVVIISLCMRFSNYEGELGLPEFFGEIDGIDMRKQRGDREEKKTGEWKNMEKDISFYKKRNLKINSTVPQSSYSILLWVPTVQW